MPTSSEDTSMNFASLFYFVAFCCLDWRILGLSCRSLADQSQAMNVGDVSTSFVGGDAGDASSSFVGEDAWTSFVGEDASTSSSFVGEDASTVNASAVFDRLFNDDRQRISINSRLFDNDRHRLYSNDRHRLCSNDQWMYLKLDSIFYS